MKVTLLPELEDESVHLFIYLFQGRVNNLKQIMAITKCIVKLDEVNTTKFIKYISVFLDLLR